MGTEALKARHGVNLRSTSGALAIDDRPLPIFNLGGFRRAIVHIDQEAALITTDGDDVVRFHIETAYGAHEFVASGELLAADLDDAQTNVPIDDAGTFVVGDVIFVGNEEMLVIATDGLLPGVLTVDRGQNGTGVITHSNNDVVNLQVVKWIEVALVAYVQADTGTSPECVIVIGSTAATPVILDDLDEALADNTILAAPLGDRLRLRAIVAGASPPTYNYSARVSLQN